MPTPTPTPDAFAALARSSPWRFATLRFTERRRSGRAWSPPVRAWLRRPGALRVEDAAGQVLQAGREGPQVVGLLSPGGSRTAALPWPAEGPPPVLRPDGLVGERPDGVALDDPLYQDYRWVAMLDPAELADPRPDAGAEPLEYLSLREVEHWGRPAWEALVRTTPAYEPRCGCCPLLRSAEVDRAEWGADAPEAEYPGEHLVRLDVGTGVCVWTEAIGGTFAGDGHDLRIEAVDEPMDDALFVSPWGPGPFGVPAG
ncbi:hypothetical protein [Blastococcus sp. SYSU D00820]